MSPIGILAVCLAGVLAILAVLLGLQLRNRQKNIKALARSKEDFEVLFRESNDGVLVIDVGDGRVLFANQAMADMLAYRLEMLQQKTIFDLQPRALLERSSERIADVWEQGGLIFEDVPFVTQQGQELPVEISAKVIPFAMRQAIMVNARDIRERLRLQGEILEQKAEIEQKNEDLTDSINYARRIQTALLPSEEIIRDIVPKSFSLYKPRDIVSGDFYFYARLGDKAVLSAVDCTGHGVPGAFMSVLGSTKLTEIMRDTPNLDAKAILHELDKRIRRTLNQDDPDTSVSDGMDLALVILEKQGTGYKVQFAGANRPLIHIPKDAIDEDAVVEIKGTKLPIGGGFFENKVFEQHELTMAQGDSLFLFSDGYQDQFGGEKGRKYSMKRLRSTLLGVHKAPFQQQMMMLDKDFEAWRKGYEQLDDVMLLGIQA